MDSAQFINRQFAAIRRVADGVTGDLTDDLLNWAPPGTCNPIAATLIHLLSAEDIFIQATIQGKGSTWEAGGWSELVGLKMLPGKGAGWEEVREGKYSVDAIRAYQEAVRAETNRYLESMTSEELDRQVMLFGNPRRVADVLAMLVTHTAHHIGEIAALKGVQGAQGMPF